MTDLVKLLREAAMSWRTPDRLVCDRAADRIEKLEATLREIIDMHPFKTPDGEASIKGLVDLVFHINLTARRALNTSEERVNKTGET